MIQNLVNAAVTGSVYVLIAIGLTMVYGQLRILHVAHGAVYTLGAFVGLLVWRMGGGLWSGLLAATIITGLAGVGIYEGVYKHIVNRPPLVALIASVAMLVLADALYQQKLFFGPAKQSYRPVSGIPNIQLESLHISSSQLTLLLVAAVLIVGLIILFKWTRIGLEWRALAQDSPMANAIGIAVHRSMMLNFFLGSALAGMAGLLVGAYEGRVYATMGSIPSYKAFVVVVMGGFGNVKGAILAGYILALLETFTIVWFGYILPRDAIAYVILILVLMFRPKGLFGRSA
jgi:branched-chain amino acid transport system permease protein